MGVVSAGTACVALGLALASLLAPGWHTAAALGVVGVTAAQTVRLACAYRRVRRYRLFADGLIEVIDRDGCRRMAHLAAGSVAIPGLAWLRVRPAAAAGWSELVAGNPRKNKDWRRLCVIFRLSAAC